MHFLGIGAAPSSSALASFLIGPCPALRGCETCAKSIWGREMGLAVNLKPALIWSRSRIVTVESPTDELCDRAVNPPQRDEAYPSGPLPVNGQRAMGEARLSGKC